MHLTTDGHDYDRVPIDVVKIRGILLPEAPKAQSGFSSNGFRFRVFVPGSCVNWTSIASIMIC